MREFFMKKLLAATLSLCIVGVAAPAFGYFTPDTAMTASAADSYTEVTYGALTYHIYSDHAEVASCDREAESVEILTKVDGVPVTVIDTHAFLYVNNVTEIVVPEGITTIQKEAFENAEGLQTVVLPESLVSMGRSAFLYCSSLTSINIPEGLTEIPTWTFGACSSLRSITIPNSVKSIGDNVFNGCMSITEFYIPESVESIGESVFYGCSSCEKFEVSPNNKYFCSEGGVLFNKDKTTLIAYAGALPNKEYTVPDTVTTIERKAFARCQIIESLTFPKNVSVLEWHSIWLCYELTKITIENPDCEIREEYGSGLGLYEGTVIYGYSGSTAQELAEEYGLDFVAMDKILLGDVDLNGMVDARDASLVLADYSLTSTGQEGSITTVQSLINADYDENKTVDARDASAILAYYAQQSVGK